MIKIMNNKLIYPLRGKDMGKEDRGDGMRDGIYSRLMGSCIFESHTFQNVGYILTPVDDTLHMVVNFAPLDNASNIG